MYATNFQYDNHYLSDFGFIVCNFDSADGVNIVNAGAKIKFNTISINKGRKKLLTDTYYEECLESTFDICKNPDCFDDLYITSEEYREIMRWLNRHQFLKFQIADKDSNDDICYYECSFNIEKIKLNERLCGLRLNMITNSPFGFGKKQIFNWSVLDINKEYNIMDYSDETGVTFPDIYIKCLMDGDLSLKNSRDNKFTIIKNCTKGEEIIIKGKTRIIESSILSHKIYNDFNFEFPKLINTYNDKSNVFTVSLPCEVLLEYHPIIKGGL